MTMLTDHYLHSTNELSAPVEINDPDFKINLAINDQARVVLFHNKNFRKKLSWLEFNLSTNRLDFVMNDGDVRNFGIAVAPDLSKYMQNAFQVLMILTDDKNGEHTGGCYYPLIIHRN